MTLSKHHCFKKKILRRHEYTHHKLRCLVLLFLQPKITEWWEFIYFQYLSQRSWLASHFQVIFHRKIPVNILEFFKIIQRRKLIPCTKFCKASAETIKVECLKQVTCNTGFPSCICNVIPSVIQQSQPEANEDWHCLGFHQLKIVRFLENIWSRRIHKLGACIWIL